MIPKVKLRLSRDLRILIVLLIIVSLIYSFISIRLHDRFMTFGLDLGYFDEAIWKISQGKFPYSGVGCIWLLEDHFQVILYFLAPLYWFWEDARVILLFQSFIMTFASLPLYLLTKKITQNLFVSFSVVFAYLFFIGTQFAILNEFHQITIAPFFIALAYYGLVNKNIRLFLWSVFFLLIIKEDLSLLVGAIGLGLVLVKEYRKLGILVGLFGIISFFLLVHVLMPSVSVKGVYDHFHFGEAGNTPLDLLVRSITDPLFFLRSMIYPAIKQQTLLQSFFTFGFLPIFAPVTYLIPLLEDFAARFIYAGPQFTKWGLVNHHAATGAMLLAISSVFGVVRLSRLLKTVYTQKVFYNLIAIYIILTTSINNLIFHGPVNSLLKKQFYEEEQWVRDNQEVIAQVPDNTSVAAQNNLLPHLTHRDNIYRIPFGLNSEYMVFDLHGGPNDYAYAPLNYEEMDNFVHNLLTSKRYSIVYQKGDAMLLKRNFKIDITKSKYYGDTKHCYYSYEER